MRALIVEDEFLIAWDIKDGLESAGLTVCGTVATEAEAVRLALTELPDIALVDMQLIQGSGLQAARPMIEAGIAVLFVTAEWQEVLASGTGHGCLEKPFAVPVLLEAVRIVQQVCRTGALPPRLHLLEPSRASAKPDPIRSTPRSCSG